MCDIRNMSCLLLIVLAALSPANADERHAGAPEDVVGRKFTARDTLHVGEETSDDARQCLLGLSWTPVEFPVSIGAPVDAQREDALIRFPSPLSVRNDESADVVMEWSMVRNADGHIANAPGVVVIHESGRNMTVGRMIAQGFRQRGVHAFLLQLPGYGARRWQQQQVDAVRLKSIPQGVADVRRARDAVAVLPWLAHDRVSLQGTSLGGFVSSTTAGLDHGYANVFLLLSGGDVYSVLQNGDRDAAKLRQTAAAAGLSDEALREIVWQIEPNRLAHRIDAAHTWLYSGVFDRVVPIENARSFATAAKLPSEHHILMPVDHFAGILLLPAVMDRMTAEILKTP